MFGLFISVHQPTRRCLSDSLKPGSIIPIKISTTITSAPDPRRVEPEAAGAASTCVAVGEGDSVRVGLTVRVATGVFDGLGGTGVITTPSRINSFSFG